MASEGLKRYSNIPENADNTLIRKFTSYKKTHSKNTGSGLYDGASYDIKKTRETLKRLKRMMHFESMDYDPPESILEREINVNRVHADYFKEEAWKWIITALIGLIMGFVGFVVVVTIEKFSEFKFHVTEKVIEKMIGKSDFLAFLLPYLTLLSISLIFGAIAAILVSYVEPLAAGSGIPEMKSYLNGIHIPGLLKFKTFFSKLIGIVFSISSGLVAGKEGPFVHGGGIVGGGLGGMGSIALTKFCKRIFSNKFELKTKRNHGGYFRNDADHRDFTAIGTAAGVASAFAAPIGGLLFTIEEGASFYSTSVLWRGFLSTSIAVFTLHFFISAEHSVVEAFSEHKFGRFRDFGLYSDDFADYGRVLFYYFWEMPFFLLLGALFGFLGAIFVHLNVKITGLRHKYIPVKSKTKRFTEAMLVVFITCTFVYLICYFSPCEKIPDTASYLIDSSSHDSSGDDHHTDNHDNEDSDESVDDLEHFHQLWCPNQEYNVYGQLFFTSLSSAVRLVLHLGETVPDDEPVFQFNVGLLFTFFIYIFVFMTWTFGIGAPTGLFVPSMGLGAVIGRIVGRLVHLIVRASGSSAKLSMTTYAIVGAAASLGGTTRMTISITVLMVETTGSLQLIVPVMSAIMVAKMVGDFFGLGIYDTHLQIRGAPYLDEHDFDHHQSMLHDKISVNEIMVRDLICLQPIISLKDVIRFLRSSKHGAFPVSHEAIINNMNTEPISLRGLITRVQLLRMLQNKIGFVTQESLQSLTPFGRVGEGIIPTNQKERLEMLDALEQVPLKVNVRTEEEEILNAFSEDELEKYYLDLRPFIQQHPFCIHENASLSRAYRLFRNLGLRHLFVIPEQPTIIGLLSRKDLSKENAMLILGEKSHETEDIASKEILDRPVLPFLPLQSLDERLSVSSIQTELIKNSAMSMDVSKVRSSMKKSSNGSQATTSKLLLSPSLPLMESNEENLEEIVKKSTLKSTGSVPRE